MPIFRIALANLPHPERPDDSIRLAEEAIAAAAAERADIICFPECYVPGYRSANRRLPPPDPTFLERAWSRIVEAAARESITVVLGTERFAPEGLVFTALVITRDGTRAGFQDKNGMLIAWQPYGQAGLLVADIDSTKATGLLAARLAPTLTEESLLP